MLSRAVTVGCVPRACRGRLAHANSNPLSERSLGRSQVSVAPRDGLLQVQPEGPAIARTSVAFRWCGALRCSFMERPTQAASGIVRWFMSWCDFSSSLSRSMTHATYFWKTLLDGSRLNLVMYVDDGYVIYVHSPHADAELAALNDTFKITIKRARFFLGKNITVHDGSKESNTPT